MKMKLELSRDQIWDRINWLIKTLTCQSRDSPQGWFKGLCPSPTKRNTPPPALPHCQRAPSQAPVALWHAPGSLAGSTAGMEEMPITERARERTSAPSALHCPKQSLGQKPSLVFLPLFSLHFPPCPLSCAQSSPRLPSGLLRISLQPPQAAGKDSPADTPPRLP